MINSVVIVIKTFSKNKRKTAHTRIGMRVMQIKSTEEHRTKNLDKSKG